MIPILLLNGPNLNLLGTREPKVYGSATLADAQALAQAAAAALGARLECLQSNHEGVLIDRLHAARTDGTRFVMINTGGLTHTSIALRDAFAGIAIPFIEVHVSNVHAREPFRQHSYLAPLAVGVIAGFGIRGYAMAIEAAVEHLGRT